MFKYLQQHQYCTFTHVICDNEFVIFETSEEKWSRLSPQIGRLHTMKSKAAI